MEFDIDCASEYIYTKEDVMCFHHSHSRHFLTFFLVSCSLLSLERYVSGSVVSQVWRQEGSDPKSGLEDLDSKV